MNARITLEFTGKNLISEEDLDEIYGGNLEQCVKDLLFSEGIALIADLEDYKLIDVERGDD